MPDLEYLLRACNITTLADAERVFEAFYPGDALSGTAITRVEAVLHP